MIRLKKYIFLFLLCFTFFKAGAQCITSFPYHEGFETSVGGWTTGGTNNDWTWGTPAKPVISSAAQGVKCWVTGGLTGSNYSNGERSWIQSPCFDFTNLPHPYIEFKIFWESERKFDGGNLQYSTNNGTSWTNVGTVNTVTDCFNDNWYNYNNITYLTTLATVKEGWCGNMQATSGICQGGFGSNGWKTAKHCLNNLAGLPNVIFRFTFGAGTSCNGFDGLGIDDIYIMNAPRYTANFGFNCTSTSNFSFSDSSTNCPSVWNWNFGDNISGANNTSSLQNPTHIFSSPGIYQVRLIATNTCSGSDTITKIISVLGVSIDSTNVSCPNGSNGKAKAIVVGATSTVSYSWNTIPIQHSDSIINLQAGTYQVVVSANNTCSITANVHIKKPNNFSHSYTTTPSICGSLNGAANLIVSGGTPTYNYSWNPNISTNNIATNVASGNYLITITDSKSCIDTMHVFVPNSSGTMTLSITNKKNATCFGKNDGSATINIIGGAPIFTYSWTPNIGNAATQNNLSAGNYNIVVTDANNCSSQIQTTISQPNNFSHSFTTTPSICGSLNGAATLNVSGGTPTYNYSWNPNVSTNNIATNVASGNYVITITDSKNCVDTMHVLVPNTGGAMVLSISNKKNTSCFGKNDGSATVNIVGGAPGFTYNWTPNIGNSATQNNLSAGNYTIVVTDANNCSSQIQTTISQPNNFSHSFTTTPSICGSLNGAATLNVSGGTPTYNYSWNPNVSTNNIATNVASGNYTITITDSKNCIDTMHVFVPNSGASMTLSITNKKNATCFGKNDGSATINIIGGAPSFTYSWIPNIGNAATQNNLSAGSYNIIVTDANNCSSQIQTTIGQPSQLSISHQIIDTKCGLKNGNAQLQVSGGTKPYQYTWTGGVSSTNNANQLGAGNYFILVSDSDNCKTGDTITIKNSIGLKLSTQVIQDSCNKSVGKIYTQLLSGTAPIKYNWQNNSSTNSYLENLKANTTYMLFATDSNLCADTVKATILSLGLFDINLGNDTFVCNAQQPLMLSVAKYKNIVWQNGSAKNNLIVIKGGEYSVTVKNNFGCTASDTINVDEKCDDVVQMPNSFTPNGDGIDDEFGGITNSPEGLKIYTISIYNRWGQLVFASNEYNKKWNGNFNNEQQPIGVYVYLVEYSFNKNNGSILLKGDLTLLR